MRTLDEVIKALESARIQVETGNGLWVDYRDNDDLKADALHYLKAYKDDRNDLTALRAYWAEQQANNPLTWDELKAINSITPLWITHIDDLSGYEYDYGWWLCSGATDTCIYYIPLNWEISRQGYGKTWQAYRKEREGE